MSRTPSARRWPGRCKAPFESCATDDAAFGTIVDPDGYILTKASELKGDDIVCQMPDGHD